MEICFPAENAGAFLFVTLISSSSAGFGNLLQPNIPISKYLNIKLTPCLTTINYKSGLFIVGILLCTAVDILAKGPFILQFNINIEGTGETSTAIEDGSRIEIKAKGTPPPQRLAGPAIAQNHLLYNAIWAKKEQRR
jgi:hypothetical protein